MTKKIKEQIDINDIFYDGAHDDAAKSQAMRSPVWPVLVAVYAFSGKQLQIGPYIEKPSGTYERLYHFLTRSGLPAAAVSQGKDGMIYVMNADHGMHGSDVEATTPYTTRISSNNPRYIMSKLKAASNHEVKDHLRSSITQSQHIFSEILRKSLDNLVDKLAGCRVVKPHVSVENSVTASLIELAMGVVKMQEIDPSVRSDIEKTYDSYRRGMDKFIKDVDRGMDMFHGDKWVVANGVLGGLVVGAISHKNLLAAYEAYKQTGSFPDYRSHGYAEATVPFKWYKSMQDIPEDIRAELEASAVMLKAHTNSAELFPPLKTYDNSTVVWESIEAFGYNSWYSGGADIVVFNR